MILKWINSGFIVWILLNEILLHSSSVYGQQDPAESVKQFGEQIGLALLDGFLQKSQEEVARQALQRQIQLLEEVNPSYAQLLKQIPPEQLIATALSQRQSYAPDTGNPFLNVLAKNGIIVSSNVVDNTQNLNQTQQQQVGTIFTSILRNILQSVQPSLIQNSLFGPHLPTQEITNPLQPNANQLVIPKPGQSQSFLPNPQTFLGSFQGPVITQSSGSDGDAPRNPFAKSPLHFATITFPPEFFTRRPTTKTTKATTAASGEIDADDEATTIVEYENSAETTEASVIDRRERRLEEINNRAVKTLALRKLRFGGNDRTEKPSIKQTPKSKETPAIPRVVRPVKLPSRKEEEDDDASVTESPEDSNKSQAEPEQQQLPHVAGINTKNFALLNQNTKTHTNFQGRTKFSGIVENGRALQLPIEGAPTGGIGRKNVDDMLLNGKLSLPKDWVSGREVSIDGSLSRRWNHGIFAGAELPETNQDN